MTTINGKVLRQIRKEHKMTLEQASHASGLHIPTISEIECGKHQPKIDTLFKLLRAYGLVLSVQAHDNRDYWERKWYRLTA